jgi:hypothetical protein
VSSRHTRSIFGLLLAVVFALSAIIVAPASAKLTKSQKAHMRHQLRKQIKKHPRLIRSKSFIKKAALSDFRLPVTIRLQPAQDPANTKDPDPTHNPNSALLDLGPSLGQRHVPLYGKVNAHIVFADALDSSRPGDVTLSLDNGPGLSTAAVPLLGNAGSSTNQSTDATPGCADYYAAGTGFAGGPSTTHPGGGPGDVDLPAHSPYMGENFPMADGSSADDVVLRTAPLSLDVTSGSGRANLFDAQGASIPQVDVGVSLGTDINTVLREVDGDTPLAPPTGGNVAALFNCRQAVTGVVHNSLNARLTGKLRISPAITADGYLRLAKVDLGGPTVPNSVEACLVPDTTLGFLANPGPAPNALGFTFNPTAYSATPTANCNAGGSILNGAPFNVQTVSGSNVAPASNGSTVRLAADLSATLKAEVLIGNVPA